MRLNFFQAMICTNTQSIVDKIHLPILASGPKGRGFESRHFDIRYSSLEQVQTAVFLCLNTRKALKIKGFRDQVILFKPQSFILPENGPSLFPPLFSLWDFACVVKMW